MFAPFLKRFFDICLAIILLVLLLVPILAISLLILASMGRPIFFTQRRAGLKSKSFVIFKFRTMAVANVASSPADDYSRVTPLGMFLRRTSLDELPQLLNVLIGDMSFVGPRPLLPEYVPLYTPEQALRHCCRPGITGWSQVKARNSVPWSEKLLLDVWYVQNTSLLLDFYILLLTLPVVLRGSGVLNKRNESMPVFKGLSDSK